MLIYLSGTYSRIALMDQNKKKDDSDDNGYTSYLMGEREFSRPLDHSRRLDRHLAVEHGGTVV